MIYVYVNYPQPHCTIHHDPMCASIQKHGRKNQRYRKIDSTNVAEFLAELKAYQIPFAAKAGFNDIWLEIALDTLEQEVDLVRQFQALIGRRYKPLARAPINTHC